VKVRRRKKRGKEGWKGEGEKNGASMNGYIVNETARK